MAVCRCGVSCPSADLSGSCGRAGSCKEWNRTDEQRTAARVQEEQEFSAWANEKVANLFAGYPYSSK